MSCVKRKLQNIRGQSKNALIVAVMIVLAAGTCLAKSKPKPDAKLEVGVVIKAIEDSLEEAAKTPVEGFPHLQTVTVSAQTTVTKEGTAGLKLYIINIGYTRNLQNSSMVSFELKPPPENPNKSLLPSIKPEDLKNALARQIQAAKVGYLDAAKSSKSLKTDKVEIQIGFTVSNEGNGGIDTGSLLPIGITFSGKLSKATANTITLDFSDQN